MDGTYGATPKPRLPNLRPPEGREDGGLVREGRYRAWWNNGCTGWDDTLYDHIQRKLDADGPFFGTIAHLLFLWWTDDWALQPERSD